MNYQQRPPSTAWEAVMIPDVLQGVIWVWNKPAHDLNSLQIEIPWETCVSARERLSLLQISHLLGFLPQSLHGWSIQGYFYKNVPEHQQVFTQLLTGQINRSLVVTLHWVPAQVAFAPESLPVASINDFVIAGNQPAQRFPPQTFPAQHVMPQQAVPLQMNMGFNQILNQAATPQFPGYAVPATAPFAQNVQAPTQQAKPVIHNQDLLPQDTPEYSRQIFKTDAQGTATLTDISADELRIHMQQMSADWTSIIQMERQLSTVRKSMDGVLARINSLNRDLTPEEITGSDSLDKKDWQDARRWLRDSITTLNRYMREYDVGLTSNAGNRNRFEAIYNEYILQNKVFPDLLTIRKEFELHRKLVSNLGVSMQTALATATRDGENRARNLLNRIASKARSKRRNS